MVCIEWLLLKYSCELELKSLLAMFQTTTQQLTKYPHTLDQYSEAMKIFTQCMSSSEATQNRFAPLREQYLTLQKYDVAITEDELTMLASLDGVWADYVKMLSDAQVMLDSARDRFKKELLQSSDEFNKAVLHIHVLRMMLTCA